MIRRNILASWSRRFATRPTGWVFRLGIDEAWILGLGAYESGWLDPHNNKINNPFGVTHGGGNNVGYESIPQAVQAWEQHFGPVVRGATSAQDFVDRLHNAKYNSCNSDWASGVMGTIKSVQKRTSPK
jgi:hypothetical protein